jgi:hypothetical protein
MNYWICKPESVDIKHLSTDDKMQVIFNQFNANVKVVSSRLDDATFCPVCKIQYNGKIFEVRVTSELLNDMAETLEDYDTKYLIFMDKESLLKGDLRVSTKAK